MSAIVTDQFRILNANNFIESVESDNNSYYVFIGLPNPTLVGYGRSVTWNVNTPDPVDNFSSNAHSGDTMMFGRKISSTKFINKFLTLFARQNVIFVSVFFLKTSL